MSNESKNWCPGFCGSCGTGCAQYCGQIEELQASLQRATAIITELAEDQHDEYCTRDGCVGRKFHVAKVLEQLKR